MKPTAWLAVLLAVSAAAHAQTSSGTAPLSDALSAKVRVLDKNTNRLKDATVLAGKPSTNLPLDITLKRCVPDVQGVPGQDVAWLDITETGGSPLFSGWMFNWYPDVAALENPRYDVRVLECVRPGGVRPRAAVYAPKDDGSAPVSGVDEAPSEDPAADGNDPNYVPGIEAPKAPEAPTELQQLMDSGGDLPERAVAE